MKRKKTHTHKFKKHLYFKLHLLFDFDFFQENLNIYFKFAQNNYYFSLSSSCNNRNDGLVFFLIAFNRGDLNTTTQQGNFFIRIFINYLNFFFFFVFLFFSFEFNQVLLMLYCSSHCIYFTFIREKLEKKEEKHNIKY